jgi:sporulation protein YlmC with PRC-barrel domain
MSSLPAYTHYPTPVTARTASAEQPWMYDDIVDMQSSTKLRYTISMLQLSESLLNKPVMSLRTGQQVATAVEPIINPNNLKIEGFYCTDRFDKGELVLLYQDIRDIIAQGFVVDDHDVLVVPDDLVRLKDTLSISFTLIGKPVVTLSKSRVGKVTDYATEMETMYIQKLYVSQNMFKSFTGGNLGIDRNQINEITDKKIIINELLKGSPATAGAAI